MRRGPRNCGQSAAMQARENDNKKKPKKRFMDRAIRSIPIVQRATGIDKGIGHFDAAYLIRREKILTDAEKIVEIFDCGGHE